MSAESYPLQFWPLPTRQNCARLLLMAFEVSEINDSQPWNSKRFEQKVITPHLFPEAYSDLRQMRARSIKLRPTVPIERFRPLLQLHMYSLVDVSDIRPSEVATCEEVLGWKVPEALATVIPFSTDRVTLPTAAGEQNATVIPLHPLTTP